MAIQCPACGRQYDVTLFQFGRSVRCPCGETVVLGQRENSPLTYSQVLSELARGERKDAEKIRRLADRISSLIVATEYPRIDIELEMKRLKETCAELFPDKAHLYHLLYESRFRRLWEQFRGGE